MNFFFVYYKFLVHSISDGWFLSGKLLLFYWNNWIYQKYILSSRRCRQSGQTRRKTYGPGETRTHDHAFRGHLLVHWATGPYWTSRLGCHMVELEVSTTKSLSLLFLTFSYCKLNKLNVFSLTAFKICKALRSFFFNFHWQTFIICKYKFFKICK